MKLTILWAVALLSLLGLNACDQSDPAPPTTADKLTWQGRTWNIKSSTGLVGPGTNYFSNSTSDVYVGTDGNLHLNIVKRLGNWYSTEVVSDDVVGYGEYKWTVLTDFDKLDPYTIIGLFTWDNNLDQANTEIDIEMARWGVAGDSTNVQFTVQPSNSGQYNERVSRGRVPSTGPTTHVFRWKANLIEWVSFQGTDTSGKASFRFRYKGNNVPRTKNVSGKSSQPITIPTPTSATNIRMNFWTMGSEFRREPGPGNAKVSEIILKSFSYTPY